MASAVDIANIGLTHIGANAIVTSLTPPDGSPESGYCARFYPIARRAMLEAHAWHFAKTRSTLAEITNDSQTWAYAYARPADCLKPLRVLALTVLNACEWHEPEDGSPFTERDGAEYTCEGDVIRTNEPSAVLVYTRDVVDTTKFTPNFVACLGMFLGGYVAGPIIKGLEGARIGQNLRNAALADAARAAALDANSAQENNDFVPSGVRARA